MKSEGSLLEGTVLEGTVLEGTASAGLTLVAHVVAPVAHLGEVIAWYKGHILDWELNSAHARLGVTQCTF